MASGGHDGPPPAPQMITPPAEPPRLGPMARARRKRRIGWFVGIGVVVLALGLTILGNVLLDGTLGPAAAHRLSDETGRVSIEVPTAWWEDTSGDAGEVFSDETGDWVVPDISAAGPTPRWLWVWVDRPWQGDEALAEQHDDFVKANCSTGEPCQTEPASKISIEGHPALRRLMRWPETGVVTVLTTINSDRWMIFIAAESDDDQAGLEELIKISNSLRLTR